MRAAYEGQGVLVLVPTDPERPNLHDDVFVTSVTENHDRDRDAALGRAVRERMDTIYYGEPEEAKSDGTD